MLCILFTHAVMRLEWKRMEETLLFFQTHLKLLSSFLMLMMMMFYHLLSLSLSLSLSLCLSLEK